jgi:hypothetical protein
LRKKKIFAAAVHSSKDLQGNSAPNFYVFRVHPWPLVLVWHFYHDWCYASGEGTHLWVCFLWKQQKKHHEPVIFRGGVPRSMLFLWTKNLFN